MIKEDKKFSKQLFICTHLKEGRSSCAQHDSPQLVDHLKKWVKENNLQGEVKVTRSGCLGYCEQGIAGILYPEGSVFKEIRLNDEEKLKEILK